MTGGTQSPIYSWYSWVHCIKINQRRVVRNQGTTSKELYISVLFMEQHKVLQAIISIEMN